MAELFKNGPEKRRSARVDLRTAISYRNHDSPGKIKNAICQNISRDGLHLMTASSLREKEPVDLWILNPETDQLINLEGEVAWVAVDDLYGDSPYWVRAGIRLTYADKTHKEKWQDLLKKRGVKPLTSDEKPDDEGRVSFVL